MAEWRTIQGSNGYEVSDDGQVRRVEGKVKRRDGVERLLPARTLTVFPGGGRNRYRRATLWINGEQRTVYVHRLVAAAFIGPCPPGYEVNHINGEPSDNRVANLEYLTSSQNKQAIYLKNRHLVQGTNNWNAKLQEVDVSAIKALHEKGFPQKWIADKFGVAQATVNKIVLGKRWQHLIDETNGE